jgi:KDO2-lipid IV(A) lauroyltransferase
VTTNPQQKTGSRADALIIFGYRVVSRLTKLIPPNFIAVLSAVLVPIVCVFIRSKRDIVGRNMQRVDPSLSGRRLRRTVQKAYESYARYYIETFRLPGLNKKAIDAKIEISGFEHIQNGLKNGKGVILALPHLGGWEWSGRWLIHQGHHLHAVVEKLESERLFAMFVDLRKSYGVDVIPLDDNAGVAVQEALANNQIVALLCDRDLQGNGVDVEFLPLGTYFGRGLDQHETVVRPAINLERKGSLREDMARVSQDLVNEIEALIRRAPDQWHLFQPNWPSDRVAMQTRQKVD